MNTDVMFSSKTPEWETPKEFFRELDAEFHFTVDVCATKENAKCSEYFTRWCNPPYGRETGKWVQKAAQATGTVVMLLPARTDTAWFHDYIYGKVEIRFIRGRLKFGDGKNSAPFPSMVCVFRRQ